MSDGPHREPDPSRDFPRTEPMILRQPVGATTWVPLLAVVALLFALGLYFFGNFPMPMPNMRADANPTSSPAPSPN